MEKIIIRDKVLMPGHVNCGYRNLCGDKSYETLASLQEAYSFGEIMQEIYSEDVETDNLQDSLLYSSYLLAQQSDKDNDMFKVTYKIDDFALHLTQNIYIYHLAPEIDEIRPQIIPWYYADSKKYMGDTWWETDEEIIESIQNLSVIDFFKRYQGYF